MKHLNKHKHPHTISLSLSNVWCVKYHLFYIDEPIAFINKPNISSTNTVWSYVRLCEHTTWDMCQRPCHTSRVLPFGVTPKKMSPTDGEPARAAPRLAGSQRDHSSENEPSMNIFTTVIFTNKNLSFFFL